MVLAGSKVDPWELPLLCGGPLAHAPPRADGASEELK